MISSTMLAHSANAEHCLASPTAGPVKGAAGRGQSGNAVVYAIPNT